MSIVGSARTDAQIEIVRRAPTEAGLQRVPIAIDETDAAVRISLRQQDAGTDPAFRSDVTLHVPHGAKLGPVHVLEGRVTLTSLSGAIAVHLQRGPINGADISGEVRLETEIGDITLHKASLSPTGLLRLRTFNGDIQLSLAERPSDARILALALNGSITSDIPLNMKDQWGPRSGETTLGRGEPVLSLDVVTGNIEIRSP